MAVEPDHPLRDLDAAMDAVLARVRADAGAVGPDLSLAVDVALEPAGIAHWVLRGEPVCPVGQLVPTCGALGWRIR